jgi:S-(hydroxymethyl)glutathione dehydrogenase / alcohol dehydrogenase
MKAAILEKQGEPLVIGDVDIAAPRAGEVRVDVRYCGLCHSDLSIIDGIFPSEVPIVLGHEAAGVVEQVGPGVTQLAPGDHVILSPVPPCGTCYGCLRGEPGTCANVAGISTNALPDGTTGLSRRGERVMRGVGVAALAEKVLTPASGAVKIDRDIPLDVVCVIGCAVQTGVGAVLNTARVEAGANVLVMGLGGIGLSIVQGARLAGAARIIVSDPIAARRDLAARLGATDAIDPAGEDLTARVMAITGGIGADYAFDAVGRSALITAGVWATRAGGTTVCVGAAPIDEAISIAPAALFTIAEKKLLGCTLGSCNSLRDIPRLVDLWRAGRLDLEALVTAVRPLAEINEAAADLRAGRGVRTVLQVA